MMKVVRGFDKKDFSKWKNVITIGGFDGIHIGHTAILAHLCEMARKKEGKGLVITFDPLPKEFFQTKAFKVITTVDEKLAILADIGVDGVFVISFTPQLSQLDAADFLEKLWSTFHPLGIVVGHNHHFGRDGKGGITLLRSFAREKHIDLQIVDEVMLNNEIVSSTRIRAAIAQGNVKEAGKMLGRPFSFSATVAKGDGIGTKLAYPTANLEVITGQKVLPMAGVYAAKVSLNGNEFGAMLYLGKRPTFYEKGRSSIEAYIMGFEGSLYGKEISVSVIERIREERKFSSPQNLKDQIMSDEVTARKIINNLAVKQGG
jgi:riboflavin kinase/FMN adenylyltransferase